MYLHQIIENGQSDNILFRHNDVTVTYGTFRNKVEQFRSYLHKAGIIAGDKVGLYCKNCPEFVYAYFGVVSLGAVIVPLNRTLTAKEVSWIAEDSGMKALLTMQPLDVDITSVYMIDEIVKNLDNEAYPFIATHEPKDENEECVIIYTSGTTGRPKGAVLTHKNLVSNTGAISKALEILETDNFLAVLPMFHSFAWTTNVLTAIAKGAKITIMEMFHPKDAVKTIATEGITVVCGVPAMFNYYLAIGTKELFSNVRLWISGGSSMPVEIIEQFKNKLGHEILEGYGLSEASPVVSVNQVGKIKTGSIGIPLPGIQLMIQGENKKVLPAGEIGELLVKGPNVMKEYFHQPEATAIALEDGWLHTGDLAYMDADGYTFIVDRLKDMIIVGGLNVYPREIEEVLYQHPTIAEAAVTGISDQKRGEVTCAFIVLKEGVEHNKKGLSAFLQEHLASYKLPRDIVVLDSLPKNATGKIVKKDLKEMYSRA